MTDQSTTDTGTGSRDRARPSGRLRELPPFGDPDEPYPPELASEAADDPRGVYLPPPEETAKSP